MSLVLIGKGKNDYYPFGMLQPERQYVSGSGYRYGFNGKEKSNEIYGDGNVYDYGFRIYNPRLGKFLSVDPLSKSYPELTPYQFANNYPIEAIDLDGLEPVSSKKKDGFGWGFMKSAIRGAVKAISYVANNPNHAGYGNGIQPNTGAPPTPAEIKRYDFSLVQQFNPNYQIENFANNLVYGTGNFISGIIEGDGEKTAQAIPPLLGAVGTVAGIKTLTVTRGMSLASKIDVRNNFAKSWGVATDYIDPKKPVYTKDLKKGQTLYQYRIPGTENGSYFVESLDITPEQVGLKSADYSEVYKVTLNQDAKVLKTTHKKEAPYWRDKTQKTEGGGEQIYNNDIKNTATFEKIEK